LHSRARPLQRGGLFSSGQGLPSRSSPDHPARAEAGRLRRQGAPSRCSTPEFEACGGGWSGRRGSNPRPTAWKAVTLPLSYSRLRARYLRPLALRRGWLRLCARSRLVFFVSFRPPSPPRGFGETSLACLAEAGSRISKPAQAGGEGRIRTSEAARATDLQSAAFDRSATSPRSRFPGSHARSRTLVICVRRDRKLSCMRGKRLFSASTLRVLQRSGWSWRRDLNPRPADYKSAALPD
jgi:hypothetical protein